MTSQNKAIQIVFTFFSQIQYIHCNTEVTRQCTQKERHTLRQTFGQQRMKMLWVNIRNISIVTACSVD